MNSEQEMRLHAPWNLKLQTPDFLLNPMHRWVPDRALDVEYHVRRSALPVPGDERELGVLVSRLHSIQVNFIESGCREVHLIRKSSSVGVLRST